MKDAVETMGAILPDDAGGRDAVHVAVFSAYSEDKLFPGMEVALIECGGGGDSKVGMVGTAIGIVDPFIKGVVPPGERFWVYLFPRTITGLAHQWTHPSFEVVATTYAAPSSKLRSEEWLKKFCETADCPGFHAVMGEAERIADGFMSGFDEEYIHFSGVDAHGEIPDEFWHHVEIYLGRQIKGQKAKYFTCSC